MPRLARRPFVVAAAAVVLLIAGVGIFLANKTATLVTGGIGYSSYAPLDEQTTFTPGGVLWSTAAVGGLALVIAGLVVLAGLGGYLVGRRHRRQETAR